MPPNALLSYLYVVSILATQDLGKCCVPNTLLLTPCNSYLGNACFRCNQISWTHLQWPLHPTRETLHLLLCPPYLPRWCLIALLTLQWKSASRDQLFATPRAVARQAPLSLEFSRQEYWSGLPFPSTRGFFPTQESTVCQFISFRLQCSKVSHSWELQSTQGS